MAAAVAQGVESRIRTLAQTKRIRIKDYFQDFDKLKGGAVTENQFFRCLWSALGLQMDAKDAEVLKQKYMRNDGSVNYMQFCNEIDLNFNPNNLKKNPRDQTVEVPEFLGTIRSVRPLPPTDEEKLLSLLGKMQKFYQYHGINLRTCYEDFDRHHMGVVTESQFHRQFPGPPDVSDNEIALLVQKYRDPDRPGLFNYLNLHHDLVAIQQHMAAQKELPSIGSKKNMDQVPIIETGDTALNEIFERIRVAVFKNGIRTTEFFRDHDKLRSGIVTESQFKCGLSLAVGKEAQLSRAEIQKVVEYYRVADDRVQYREFCQMMENAFNIPELEKKPLQNVVRPQRGALSRTLKGLTDEEDMQCEQILQKIREQVQRRRLMIYPYFKDHDRGVAYTRVVTPTQFSRVLHYLSLNVNPEELKLLLRKFQDPASGDVNYPAFVQTVDKEFVGHTLEDVSMIDQTRTNVPVVEKEVSAEDSNVSFEELMARIRHIVLTNRLRVIEFFQDFDPLRSGYISKTQFKRALATMGLSKLGSQDLTEAQYQMLAKYYESSSSSDKVCWKQFHDDIENVFTQPGLEKAPTYQVPQSEVFRVPKPGTVNWEGASQDHLNLVAETMNRLQQKVNQRRILCKPCFQDFDRHNNGHVTKTQFRQCLTYLQLNASEEEMKALEAKFCNDMGFNYIAFLQELQPYTPPDFMYEKRLEDVRQTNVRTRLPETDPISDLEGVLIKIKTKVSRERLRVLDFMKDYDKLRSGRMLKTSFRRALDLCGFQLKESEICILEDRYQSRKDPDYVEYTQFCDEVESIFTFKELEKAPLQEVVPFKPPEEWKQNAFKDAEEQQTFENAMYKIAEKVRKHQMQLFPLFEDYDRVHRGCVSESQFHRVLTELELGSLVNRQEIELISNCFLINQGRRDVYYIGFCDKIYEIAKFEWRKP